MFWDNEINNKNLLKSIKNKYLFLFIFVKTKIAFRIFENIIRRPQFPHIYQHLFQTPESSTVSYISTMDFIY